MRYAIPDVHGCNKTLKKLLKKINLQKEDKIIFLGDYIDRGPDSYGVLQTVSNLQCETILLKGNHEEMAIDYFNQPVSPGEDDVWRSNGGEPFLYPYLQEFVSSIDKKEIFITTNGSCISNINVIGPYLTAMNISIHHWDEKINSKIIGTEVYFDKIKKNISILNKLNVKVRINCNLTKDGINNEKDAMKMIDTVYDLGANSIRFTELQNNPKSFISAKNVFPFSRFNEDPYNEGCEHNFDKFLIPVTIKVICKESFGCHGTGCHPLKFTKVVFPDASIGGW